jgi:hypothetical protein
MALGSTQPLTGKHQGYFVPSKFLNRMKEYILILSRNLQNFHHVCVLLFIKNINININPYIGSFLRMSYFTTLVAICVRKLKTFETVRSFVQFNKFIFLLYVFISPCTTKY